MGGLVPKGDGSYFGTTFRGGLYNKGTVFNMAPDGTITVLWNFNGANGEAPVGKLLLTTDGNLWGTTQNGGNENLGTIFRLTPGGQLTSTSITSAVGESPRGRLAQDAAGNLYGVTSKESGTIFKLGTNGQLSLHATLSNPRFPANDLMTAADGNVYGVASTGNSDQGGAGAIFRVETAGGISIFARIPIDPYGYAQCGLVQDAAGNFYGTTNGAGTYSSIVYRCTPQGVISSIGVLPTGSIPGTLLLIATDGKLYGATSSVGQSPNTLFRASVGTGVELLYPFNDNTGSSISDVVERPDGSLLGTVTFGFQAFNTGTFDGGVFEYSPSRAILSQKVKFTHAAQNPAGSLAVGQDGTLYGVTTGIGNLSGSQSFRLSTTGTYTALSQFQGNPSKGLTTGADGKVHGMISDGITPYTSGVFFRLNPNGLISQLGNLGSALVGSKPSGELVVGSDGCFYGATTAGNAHLFRINTAGQISKIAGPFLFTPTGRACFGSDGSAYLAHAGRYGQDLGGVFRVLPDGTTEQLVAFDGSNGAYPAAGLVVASDGNFYGTTRGTGLPGPGQHGTIYRITPSGAFSTVVTFDGANGSAPKTELTPAADSKLYGTTSTGGSGENGTIFSLSTAGTLTTLVEFDYYNGSDPSGALTSGPDGQLYGATRIGGVTDDHSPGGGGTLFKLNFAPVVVTGNAKVLSATATQLNGVATTHGRETVVSFEYGTDPLLNGASSVAVATIPEIQSGGAMSSRLDDLAIGTTYYFRLKAACAGMPAFYGEIHSFVASGIDPNAGPREFLFCALDMSRDDRLNPEEWERIYVKAPVKETAFALVDANKDGLLDFSEFSAAAYNRTATRIFASALARTVLFLQVDVSEDNQISKAELSKMWKPGTDSTTIDLWLLRAGLGNSLDFWQWLHVSELPNERTYKQATEIRNARLAITTQLDINSDGIISFEEFSRMFNKRTKTPAIDAAWRAANQTPKGETSPASMTIEAFIEAPRLPKLLIY